MEIYSFYQAIQMNMQLTNNKTVLIISAVLTMALWVTLFILQGIGICAMAKKQGLKKRGLAFVPFVNIWYVGKLAGECHFFGQRMKRAGMYAMIAQILLVLVSILTIAAEQYLWMTQGAPTPEVVSGYTYYYWTNLSGFALHVSRFFDISGYILPIFQLLVEIFLVVIMMGLCKKYAPKNYMLLGMLVLFVPISRFIIIFVLRKRQPIDYEAYMRARHEAYMRAQQQYYNRQNPYGNPYSNPYGNPYNPQNQNYGSQNGNQGGPKPADPFEEFSSETKEKGAGEPFEEMRGGSDDFFS